MKLRHPWLIRAAGLVAAGLVRLWMGTLRYRYRPVGPDMDPQRPDLAGHYIYAAWHETLLLPLSRYARVGICMLMSRHADGQLIGEVCRRLGIPRVYGSTNHGGVEALRQLIRASRGRHIALTPDGPQGPRRQVKLGVIYLAARSGLPIVPVGVGYHRAWRLRSWDRFAIPGPWTLATCVTTPPITVPADCTKEGLEHYRQRVEAALAAATEAAERWAAAGAWPESLPENLPGKDPAGAWADDRPAA